STARYEVVSFDPMSSDGFKVTYGYNTFSSSHGDYKVLIKIKDGAITYARSGSAEPDVASVPCTSMTAGKIRRVAEEEARLRKSVVSKKGGIADTPEEKTPRANTDAPAPAAGDGQ